MMIRRAYVPRHLVDNGTVKPDEWPYTVPCVRTLLEGGLELRRPVTFLVGENGSGKSTLVEAIAEAYGLDARGGRAGRKYGNDRPKTPLGEVLALDTTNAVSPRKRRGYFLRAETAFGFMEFVSGMRGYWEEETSEMSHGESFLVVFENMFRDPGLYVMDEPEAALSFTSCLSLVRLMHSLGQRGAQVICATHSPLLTATPGADIVEIGDHGMQRTSWGDLDLVDHWRRYLTDPTLYLRRTIDAT